MDFKEAGNHVYVLGVTDDELGASVYLRRRGELGVELPAPQADAIQRFRSVHRAIRAGVVRACHDCSEGGVAVAVAEMAYAGGLGVEMNLAGLARGEGVDRDDVLAFSESLSRFVLEVRPEHVDAFEATMSGLACEPVGTVTSEPRLRLQGLSGAVVLDQPIDAIEQAWRGHLR
jgi:phosphoribosylformylglycinamidine synthase